MGLLAVSDQTGERISHSCVRVTVWLLHKADWRDSPTLNAIIIHFIKIFDAKGGKEQHTAKVQKTLEAMYVSENQNKTHISHQQN